MSLPDIMIIDTGRKDLSMLLPDVVKAESFAGRISHSYSLDSLLNYVYCPSPAVDGCVACLIEKCATSGKNGKAPEAASNHDCSGHQNNSKVKGPNKNIMMKNGKKVNNKGEITTEDHPRSKIQSGRGDDAHGVSVGACSEHSPINFQNDHQASPVSRSDPLGKKNCERIVSASSSSKSGSFRRGWTREFQLSQHVHKLRDGSRSSSSKTSSSKCYPLSYQSSSGDSTSLKMQKSKRLKLRINPADSNSHERDHNEQFIDGISYSGVFRKLEPNLCLETQHDTLTTDQADFSSKLTESMYITDTPMATPVVRSFTINRDPFINKLKNGQDIDGVDFDHQEDTTQKKQHCVGHGVASNSGDITKADILSSIQTNSDENRMTVGTDNNQACSVNLSNSHSCLLKEDSEDESDESSGIFCGRSPGHRRRDMTIKPNRQLKKETQSELAQECSTDEKHIARRVKSNT